MVWIGGLGCLGIWTGSCSIPNLVVWIGGLGILVLDDF